MSTNKITAIELVKRIQIAAHDLAGYMPPLAHHLNGIATMASELHHSERCAQANSFLAGTDAVARAVNLARRLEGREPVDFAFPLEMGGPSRELSTRWDELRDRLQAAQVLDLLPLNTSEEAMPFKGRTTHARLDEGRLWVRFPYNERAMVTVDSSRGLLSFVDLTDSAGQFEAFAWQAPAYELLTHAAEKLLAPHAAALDELMGRMLGSEYMALNGPVDEDQIPFYRLCARDGRTLELRGNDSGDFHFRYHPDGEGNVEWAEKIERLSMAQRAAVAKFLDEYASEQGTARAD